MKRIMKKQRCTKEEAYRVKDPLSFKSNFHITSSRDASTVYNPAHISQKEYAKRLTFKESK